MQSYSLFFQFLLSVPRYTILPFFFFWSTLANTEKDALQILRNNTCSSVKLLSKLRKLKSMTDSWLRLKELQINLQGNDDSL